MLSTHWRGVLGLLLATCCLNMASARAENWPAWRGAHGDGVSQETNLPLHWSEERHVAWKQPLPYWGSSTPAVWEDALFITGQQDDRLILARLAADTGDTIWTRDVGTAETPRKGPMRETQKFHDLHNNASPSPVTDGEVMIAHFGNGELAAYDLDGTLLWQRNLQQEHGTYTIWWGHANSPVLVGDLVVSVCMQDSLADLASAPVQSYLVAHDKRTGKEVWKSLRMTAAESEAGDSYTTPLLIEHDGVQQLVVMGGNQIDAYSPADGKQLWFLPGISGGRTITGPTAGQAMIFATQGMRGPLLGIQLGNQPELNHRDIVWKHAEATPDTCCPVLVNDLLFIINDDGIAQCFNARTGKVNWKRRIGGNFKASPVAAEGRVYFLNMKGLMTVIAASDRYELLAENQLDDETTASPAIANGKIYIRGRNHLYCLQK